LLQKVFYWIRNNWRLKKRAGADPTRKKMSRIQMVWRQRKEEVEEEMRNLYDTEGGTGRMNNRTKLRLWPTAATKVYRELEDEEKAEIDRAIEKTAAQGNPPEIQQKRATKLGAAKIQQWSAERWKDMGMLTVTFYAYKDTSNQVAIGV
jgi:hypothetical protein